jgi:trigger factor
MSDIVITKGGEEPGAKNFKVEVPLDRVDAATRKAAAYYAKRLKLPGFRKGKVPLSVIHKKYRDAVRQDALRELVDASWKTTLDQEELQPIAEPQVRSLKFDEGEPITFELVVAVKPELDLQRVGGFQLTRRTRSVTDEMVTAQLDELRGQRALWAPVEGERPEVGNLVSVTITPLEHGEPGESKQYQLVLGDGQALPDVEDRILQMTPGQEDDVVVKFPDDFADEAKRGQSRAVRIELHEVKRQQLPDLSDEFAREVGDFDSVQALREAVRADLEDEAKREADADVRTELLEQIQAANNVEAPRPLVQRVLSAFAKAYQVPDDQLERFATEFAPVAERQVKRDLIVDHLTEREQLKASEEEVDERIETIAAKRKTEPRQVYASLQKANRLSELERSITEEKVFNYLVEQSTVTDEQR